MKELTSQPMAFSAGKEVDRVVSAQMLKKVLKELREITRALLQTFQHSPRHVLSLLPQHFEVFLHRVKLRLQDALLQLLSLIHI